MNPFAVSFIAICAVAIWLGLHKQKALALSSAGRYCRGVGVQLLDESVLLLSGAFISRSRGGWAIALRYRFEFSSTGERRYQGEIECFGGKVFRIELEPHVMDEID